jgi:hemolysin III
MAQKREEIVNSTTHGVGIGLAIAATVILIVRAALYADAWHIVTYSIFGAGLINLYVASTLFHSAKNVLTKYYLNRFDHSSIYVLIAATYTPFSLTALRGPLGWVIFGLIWAMAIGGIIFKTWFYSNKHRTLSMWLYIAMGWLIILFFYQVIKSMPAITVWFLVTGCLSYFFGAFFYLNKKIPFGHGIFHLFIIGGSTCHFFALYFLI